MDNIVAYHCHHTNAFQWCDNIFIAGKRSVSRSIYFFRPTINHYVWDHRTAGKSDTPSFDWGRPCYRL